MTDINEAELRLRRERGRRAQAAFRKRQALAVQDLAEQNQKLVDGIEKIIKLTRADTSLDLLAAISNVADIAGVPFETPPRSSVGDDARSTSTSLDLIHQEEPMYVSDSWKASISLPASTLASPARISAGLWLNPVQYMRISIPPSDIVSYLGPGSETLAGSLFWSIMGHTQHQCNRGDHPDPTPLIRRGLSHSSATRDTDISFVEAMVEARLEYKQKGSISPQYAAAAEADLPIVLAKRVHAEYRSRGLDPNSWLTCLDIEARVRRLCGENIFQVIEMAARGRGAVIMVQRLDDLKCKLYDTAVCFGDGPRWQVAVVDGLFFELIGSMLK